MENNGCIRGFLSDLEYAKAMNNESASSDPKTVCLDVEDRSCLTFDQGTPYFMPLEIHRGQRYADEGTKTPFLSFEEEEQILFLPLSAPPITILKYNYNHDPESLMWVALYIVFGLVDWKAAQEVWPNIFTNSLYPSPDREEFFMFKESPFLAPFFAAFHDQLLPGFPTSFELIRRRIWHICMKSEPKEQDYHDLFNNLIPPFDRLLNISFEKARDMPFVERSGQANVGTSQSATAKRKMENTDEADIMRVRTAPPVKRARSSTSKAEGKTAGKTAGKAKAKKQ